MSCCLSGPLVRAQDQPPAPGANWIIRLWHVMRRTAGRALDALPQKSNLPIIIARIVLVVVLWLVIAAIAYEVIALWVIFVLPFQLLKRRGRGAVDSIPFEAALWWLG